MKKLINLTSSFVFFALFSIGCDRADDVPQQIVDEPVEEIPSIVGVWENPTDSLVFLSFDESGNFYLCAGTNLMFAGKYQREDERNVTATDCFYNEGMRMYIYEVTANRLQIMVYFPQSSPVATYNRFYNYNFTLKKVSKPFPKSMTGTEWFLGDGLDFATYYRCIGDYDAYRIHRHNGTNKNYSRKYIYREPLLYDWAEVKKTLPSIVVRKMISFDDYSNLYFKSSTQDFTNLY